MNDDYLDAFVRESEESITELNNALLALESDPDDGEAMDRVFRTAHTLKGNFGAMGFGDASDLAHAMEDLLSAIRDGDLAATPDVMDEVFEGVDRIESILDEIEDGGDPSTDVGDQVAAIRETLEEGEADATADDGGDAADGPPAERDGDGASDAGASTESGGANGGADGETADGAGDADDHCRVRVELADTDMPGVDAMLALETVEGDVGVVGTEPPRDLVEEGTFEDSFTAVVEAADPDEAVAAFDRARQVETATVPSRSPGDDADAASGDVVDEGDGDGGDDASDPTADAISTDDIKSVRVDVGRLDDLYGLVERLVTSRIKLRRAVEATGDGSAAENLDELDKITTGLQDTVMDMRLVPVKRAVNTFPRLVRDLARDLDKQVAFEMEGTGVELDRTILDEISDPLMHVIRNAVDHGIEPPDVRAEEGKPETGTVRLRAERERDSATITVSDDGAGLDVEEIREAAAEQGIREPAELESMPDSAVYDLVYHPGFSTSDEVTDVSGRGVGMDVVHRTVDRLDGDVSVESDPGGGTTVTVELPVSMAIVKVLFVTVGDREYGIPIKNIEEVGRDPDLDTVRGREVVSHDGGAYPVVDLAEALELDRPVVADGGGADGTDDAGGGDDGTGGTDGPTDGTADDSSTGETDRRTDEMYLRVRESVRPVVLRCGRVTQQEEVVIKPFQGRLSDTPGLSGTAVVGDGNVVPIIDVTTL